MRMSSTLDLTGPSGKLQISCAHCGHMLGPAGKPWKPAAVLRERPIRELGASFELDGEVVLREFVCPECRTLLDTELARRGDPFLDDIIRV